MWDMAALLTQAGRANLAAVGTALPAPPLPADPHADAAASDARPGAAARAELTVEPVCTSAAGIYAALEAVAAILGVAGASRTDLHSAAFQPVAETLSMHGNRG